MNTNIEKNTVVELPQGFTARGTTLEDIESAMALFNRWSRSVTGEDEMVDSELMRNDLQSPGFNIHEDTRLVFAPDGELAGYIEAWTIRKPPVHPWLWGRVDPKYEGRAIGTWLMHWAEERVLRVLPDVPEGLRFAPQVSTYRAAERAKRLFEKLDYHYFRSSYHMRIEFDEPVTAPEIPGRPSRSRTYKPPTPDAESPRYPPPQPPMPLGG